MIRKKFNITGLILHNIIGFVKKKKITFPYGFLLTKIIKYSRLKLDDRDKVEATKFANSVSQTQSNMRITFESLIRKIPAPPIPLQIQHHVSIYSQPKSTTISAQGIFKALVDILMCCLTVSKAKNLSSWYYNRILAMFV